MRNRNLLIVVLLAVATGTFFSSCKKENKPEPITGEALFSYVADGKTVTFTNESTVSGTVTYLWDFGDDQTSTEKDPVHTYEFKGEYTVTLTVTDEQGGEHTVSTKIKVDKKNRIDLTDNSLDDWNAVTEDKFIVSLGDNTGVVKAAKYDYDADMVYAYIEFEGNLEDVTQYDIFMDFDNDSTTGFKSYLWPASGANYLVEIAPFTGDAQELGAYKFIGVDGTEDWNWEFEDLGDGAIVIGTMKQVGNNVACELGFSRSKITGLANDMVGFGTFISDADWAEIGFAPDATEEGGAHKGYFVLDMR